MAASPSADNFLEPEYLALLTKGWHPRPVATAGEAEAYAQAAATHIYGPDVTRQQLPFHAEPIGLSWRVVGSRPWQGFAQWYSDKGSGPLTLVFGGDGVIQSIYFTSDRVAPRFPPTR